MHHFCEAEVTSFLSCSLVCRPTALGSDSAFLYLFAWPLAATQSPLAGCKESISLFSLKEKNMASHRYDCSARNLVFF